jgi:hypothetical protein
MPLALRRASARHIDRVRNITELRSPIRAAGRPEDCPSDSAPVICELEWPGRYRGVRVLPAGQQDQRCCGGDREQCDQAGGGCPTGSGRPPDLIDQPSEGVSPLFHCCLPGSIMRRRSAATSKLCGRSDRLGRAADLVNAGTARRDALAGEVLGQSTGATASLQ